MNKPKGKEDVLEQLEHVNGVWSMIHAIEDNFAGVKQIIPRAADEVRRLRDALHHIATLSQGKDARQAARRALRGEKVG